LRRPVSLRLGLDVGALQQEQLNDLVVAEATGQDERRVAFFVAVLDVRLF
jgi:hypothetical protein